MKSRSNPFDVDAIMDTFRIVVDTREQDTPKAKERFNAFGCQYIRGTIHYGDYCACVDLPDGKQLFDSVPYRPAFAIERKMSLDELAVCFTRGRDRFQREFDRATEQGARMILLVENGSWEAIRMHRYRSRMKPEALEASLIAWTVRYGLTPLFCKSDTAGHLIRELLFRDMKLRVERGEY